MDEINSQVFNTIEDSHTVRIIIDLLPASCPLKTT
jgi:hypothetical protein